MLVGIKIPEEVTFVPIQLDITIQSKEELVALVQCLAMSAKDIKDNAPLRTVTGREIDDLFRLLNEEVIKLGLHHYGVPVDSSQDEEEED